MTPMPLSDKLAILSDAARYDASCASSGTTRRDSRDGKGLGSTEGSGICHSYAPDGRCISLLKILMTNFCIYDCAYCINRAGNDIPLAAFTPDEIVSLTVDFYRRNYIEGLFLSDPLFAQFIVIGDRRKFLSALLTINLDVASHLAHENNIPFTAPGDLLTTPAFLALVDARVQSCNSRLARFETIKKYHIVQREFSQEMGELTPSLKLKRNVVLENFQSLVEEMYAE